MTWGTFWTLQSSCQNYLLSNNFNSFLWFKYFWKHHVKTVFKSFPQFLEIIESQIIFELFNIILLPNVLRLTKNHFDDEKTCLSLTCIEWRKKNSSDFRMNVSFMCRLWMTVPEIPWDIWQFSLRLAFYNNILFVFWMSQRPKQRNLKESFEQVDVTVYYQFHVSFWIVLVSM